MSIRLEEKYPLRSTPATTAYPGGSMKNETTPGAKDGTPVDILWGNDWLGFFQKIIADSGITPSDVPDTALVSDYLEAMSVLFNRRYDNLSALRDIDYLLKSNQIVSIGGRETIGDGGGGIFYWHETSTKPDNDAYIIKIDAITTGRLIRQTDGDLATPLNAKINALWFSGADIGEKITNAVAASYGDFQFGEIYVPTGTYVIDTTVNMADLGILRYSIIDFRASKIIIATDGTPAFDCTGTGGLIFKNGYLESTLAEAASCCFLFAPTATYTNSLGSSLQDMTIAGRYTRASVIGICLAPLTFIGEVSITNSTPGITLSLSRTNTRSEVSVYSTIKTDEDAISFWAGSRAEFFGGNLAGVLPVIEFEGRDNHISLVDIYLQSMDGGPYAEFNVTNEDMDRIYIKRWRTEAAVTPDAAIVVKGANLAALVVDGGTYTAVNYLIDAPNASLVYYANERLYGSGRKIRCDILDVGEIDLSNILEATVTTSIAGNLVAKIVEFTDIAKLIVPAAYENRVRWEDKRGNKSLAIARRITSTISCTAGVPQTVIFNSKDNDLYAEYSITTGRFTALKHGFYTVISNFTVVGTIGDLVDVQIDVNGTKAYAMEKRLGNGTDDVSLAGEIELFKDDYMEIVYNNSTNNSAIQFSPTRTTMLSVIGNQ